MGNGSWTPPNDAVEATPQQPTTTWIPPSDAAEVSKEVVVKKKDTTLPGFISSFTAPLPGSGPQSPSATSTVRYGSLSTGASQTSGTPSSIPTTGASNVPNALLFRNPYLNHEDYKSAAAKVAQDNAIASKKAEYARLRSTGMIDPNSPAEINPQFVNSAPPGVTSSMISVGSKGSAWDTIYADEVYNQSLSFNQSVMADGERMRLLEQTPGSPEYNAKMYPGVALPVAQENTTEKARRYYRTYLGVYNPQALADHDEEVRGQAEEVRASGDIVDRIGVPLNEIKDDVRDDTIILQKTQAEFDQRALEFMGKGAYTNFSGAVAIIDTQYKNEMDAVNKLQAWPADANGQPIINTNDDLVQYQSLVDQVQNPEFQNTFAQAAVAQKQLGEVHQAGVSYLNEYPLWREQFNLVKKSQSGESGSPGAKTDEAWLYDNVFNPIADNVINPIIRTLSSAVESVAYLPKAFGSGDEYGWTDSLYDQASLIFGTKAGINLPTAGEVSQNVNPYTGETEQVFEEDFLPGLVGSVTQVALIIGGGEIPAMAGLGESVALTKVSQVATASALTMNHFYEAGKGAGMSEQEAQYYSIVSGMVSGSFMAVNPIADAAATSGTIAVKSAQEYAAVLANTGSVSFARQAAMKSLINEIAGVNFVGIAQKLSEYGTNYLANTITGANLDTGQNLGRDMWDVVAMSTIMAAGFGGVRYGKDIIAPNPIESRPYQEALFAAAKDPGRYKDALLRMQDKGIISAERMRQLSDHIDKSVTALQTAPPTLTPAQKAELLPRLMEKQELLKQSKVTDNTLKPVVEQQIQQVDAEIRNIAGVKSEEQLKMEKDQEQQDLVEYQELLLEKAALGEVDATKAGRFEELTNKFTEVPESEKFVRLAREAKSERELDTIMDQADKANASSPELLDEIGKKRAQLNPKEANPVTEIPVEQPIVEPVVEQTPPVVEEPVATTPERRVNVDQEKPTDIIDADVAVEDQPAIIEQLNKDIEATKQVSVGKVEVKRKAVEKRINEAEKNRQITPDSARSYRKAIQDIAEGRKKQVKQSANAKIDKSADAIIGFYDKYLGGTKEVTNPDGTKSPIQKLGPSLDVERLVRTTADILKAAVSRGIDMNIAINNMMAAISSHPAFKSMNDQDREIFKVRMEEEYKRMSGEMKEEIDALDTKERKTLSRALESPFVDESVKMELNRLGPDYIPQKNKLVEQDARRIVEFNKEIGELGSLEQKVRDMGNGMGLLDRGAIFLELIKDYTAESRQTRSELDAATPETQQDMATKHKIVADKLANLMDHGAKIGTQIGQYMQYVHKGLKRIFESAPQDVVQAMIDKQVKSRAKEITKESQKTIDKTVTEINKRLEKGPLAEKEITDIVNKKMPGFEPEIQKEIEINIKKTIDEKGSVDATDLNKTYEAAIEKEIMRPAVKEVVDKSLSVLKEYEKKTSEAKKAIDDYKKAVELRRKMYDEAIKNKTELTPEEIKTADDSVSGYHDKALDAARDMQAFELRAEEAQNEIMRKLDGPRDIYNTLVSFMTGNLLRLRSLGTNILSYIPTVALRGTVGGVASMADFIQTKAYNAFQKARGSEKRAARSVSLFNQVAGAMKYGARPGHAEAFRRVLTGSMPGELGKLEGHSTINSVNAWKDLLAKRSPAENKFWENRISAALEGTIGVAPDIVFRLLQLGDAPPRKMAEMGKLYEIGKQKGLNEAELLEHMFFPDEASKSEAQEFGKKATYQNDNMIAQRARDLIHVFSSMAEKAGNRHLAGVLKIAEASQVPFVKTPVNIIAEVAMYSNPAIPFTMSLLRVKKSVEALRNGNTEAATRYRGEANMLMAKSVIGLGIMSLALSFARKGLMTPGFDREDSESERLAKEQGIKPSSFNVSAFNRLMHGDAGWDKVRPNDYWMNYAKMGTLGMAFNVWAETIHDNTIEKDPSGIPRSTLGMMADAGLNTVSTAFDQSFLTGTSTLMDAMHSKDYDRVIPNTLMAFTSIALPGTVQDVSKATNEAQKVTSVKDDPMQTYRNKLKLGTFQGDELQDKVGLFGETLSTSPRGTSAVIYNVVDPYGFYQPGGTEPTDQVIDFYNSVEEGTEGKNKILPTVPQQTMKINGQTVMLTDQEYHDFKVMVGMARAAYVRPYLQGDFAADDFDTRVETLGYMYRDGYEDAKWLFIDSTPRLREIEYGVPEEE